MKKAIVTMLGLGVVAFGLHAAAGLKTVQPVSITSTIFSGNLGDARSSSDTRQFIQCNIAGNTLGALFGSCGAMDAGGTSRVCSFDARVNPTFAQALATMTSSSNIAVWYNANGTCGQIQVQNSSANKPPVP